jgi:hypothetical protein
LSKIIDDVIGPGAQKFLFEALFVDRCHDHADAFVACR